MTDISDELRRVADEWDVTPLYALADRIDNAMVEWPLGADRKPVKPGQHVYKAINGDLSEYVVHSLRCDSSVWVALVNRAGADAACIVRPDILTHENQDSLGRIADELEAKTSSCGHQGFVVVSRDEVVEIADRIRTLAEREGK